MSGSPNFEAYRRYTEITSFEPVTVVDGGKPGTRDDYIQVDYNGFRNVDAQTTERLVDRFARVAGDGRMEETQISTPDSLQNARDQFSENVNQAQNNNMFAEKGGGFDDRRTKILYIDARVSSFNDFTISILGKSFPNSSANDERLFDQYTREHETAHQMLGLLEAGADYIAAVRLLQTNPGPETRKFLQNMADLRAINPFRIGENAVGEDGIRDYSAVMTRYGHGCSTAINSALSTPDIDIETMTPEQMYDHAGTYDEMNGNSGKVTIAGTAWRPEMVINSALRNFDPNYTTVDIRTAALTDRTGKLIESGRYDRGSTLANVLEDLHAASRRIDASLPNVIAGPIVTTPAPAPSPQV